MRLQLITCRAVPWHHQRALHHSDQQYKCSQLLSWAKMKGSLCVLPLQDKLFRSRRMSIYNQSFYVTMVSALLSFSGVTRFS